MKDFRDLKVWLKSHELTLSVYKATTAFPLDERFGLTSQIRRGSSSIPANIAEGCGRGSDADLARFLHISMGSASELEYHLMLARDLTFLSRESYAPLAQNVIEIKKMLASFLRTLKADR